MSSPPKDLEPQAKRSRRHSAGRTTIQGFAGEQLAQMYGESSSEGRRVQTWSGPYHPHGTMVIPTGEEMPPRSHTTGGVPAFLADPLDILAGAAAIDQTHAEKETEEKLPSVSLRWLGGAPPNVVSDHFGADAPPRSRSCATSAAASTTSTEAVGARGKLHRPCST